MEAFARPLRRLHEDLAWFVRATEVRLLHVATDAGLRGAVLDLVMAQEFHADNRALFLRFDDPLGAPHQGWPSRARSLRSQVADKAKDLRAAGIHMKPLAWQAGPTSSASASASADFAVTLLELGNVIVAPLTGALVVFAPTRVHEPTLFLRQVMALTSAPQLGHVRIIVVESDGIALKPPIGRMGGTALSCECFGDEGASEADLVDLVSPGLDHPEHGGPSIGGWSCGGAVPDVRPPVRRGTSPPAKDGDLGAAGLSPVFINGGGGVLKRLVLGAALAVRRGDLERAITLQTGAVTLCAEMNMTHERIVNLHVLAGYLLAASSRDRAREVYLQSADLAREHLMPELASQSELALGMLAAVDRRSSIAATHYAAAGKLAEEARVPALAMECWRMAGQLALDVNRESTAVECWNRALLLAEPLDPALVATTSAVEIAQALAAVYRKRGLVPQADALDQRF